MKAKIAMRGVVMMYCNIWRTHLSA